MNDNTLKPGYNAVVYFVTNHTKQTMRYGCYRTFHEASDAVKELKKIHDNVYIEEKYINPADWLLNKL